MLLSSYNFLTFLSCRHGDRKDGGAWYSVNCYDDRGNTYTFYYSENVKPSAIDALSYARLGDHVAFDFDVVSAREGKFYLRVNDMHILNE